MQPDSRRLNAAVKFMECWAAGTHRLTEDNNFCETCDTGECLDCGEWMFYSYLDEGYHHIRYLAPACFLIQEEMRTWLT